MTEYHIQQSVILSKRLDQTMKIGESLEAFFTCCFQICKEMVYNSPKKNITKRRKISLQNAEKHDN